MLASSAQPRVRSDRPALAICDDHLLVAQGLALALGRIYDIKAVLRSGRALEELLLTCPPDAIVTEIDLLDQSGIEALERTRSLGVGVPFVICTSQADPVSVHRAFYAGARGVIAKGEGVAALQSAIDLALEGKVYLSDAFMQMLISEQRLPVVNLTSRQRTILQLMDDGLTAQQIADKLGLSRRTVESHKFRMLRITDTHSPQELLVRAKRLGLLRPAGVRRKQ
jgi:DNA-binding NarL/FixJ family response regulator